MNPTRWLLLTLPLSVAAAFLYGAFEWVFFATKPSVLTALPAAQRVLALFDAAAPFVPALLAVQAAATLISLTAFPRLRAVAVIPAAGLLACLTLILSDNFTYILFGFSSIHAPSALTNVYLLLLAVVAVLAGRAMYRRLASLSDRAIVRTAVAIWIVALLPSAFYVRDLVAPPPAVTPLKRTPPPMMQASAIGTQPRVQQWPNVLFLASDGMDAERLSAYGYEHPTTPFLQSIAGETLFCENAFPNASRTHGSLVSLLTGRLATRTKVIFPPTALQGEAATQHLPGLLRASGYRTIQLAMRHYGDAEDANLVGAFDLANYRWERVLSRDAPQAKDETRPFRNSIADRLEERILHVFRQRKAPDDFAHVIGERRQIMWSDARRIGTLLQFMESAPEPWMAHVHLLDTHVGQYRRHDKQVGIDGYDTVLRTADDWFRTVFDALEKNGQLDRTIVAISSDHSHRWLTYERVPLMIRFPGGAHARREQRNVQLADVAPTILDYLDAPAPSWMDGQSLLQPQHLRSDRPIIALGDIGKRRDLTSHLRELEYADPPNYGVRTATIVVGSQWLELELVLDTFRSGVVKNHTNPSQDAVPAAELRRWLADELRRNGFRVGIADAVP